MADFMTLAGVQQVANDGKRALDIMLISQSFDTDNLVQQAIDHIEVKIAELKGEEQRFLSMFDGCSTIGDFKSKVAEYYRSYNLMTFTGSHLRSIVEEYKKATDINVKKRAELIELMISNLIRSEFVKDSKWDLVKAFENKEVNEAIADYVMSKLNEALSGKGLGGGGILTSSKYGSSQKSGDGSRIFEIAANKTTAAFNTHLAALQTKVNKDVKDLPEDSDEYKAIQTANILLSCDKKNLSINGLNMEQSFGIRWYDLIHKATKSGTGKGSDINVSDQELGNINVQITDMIVNRLGLDSAMSEFVRKRITDMYGKDPKMFFVGNSYTQLEGVLGEVNSVIAITALLGERYKSKALDWIGSQMGVESKKQPSIDVVLNEICGIQFGIQVKNTTSNLTEDIEHYINFADKSIEEIFKSLGVDTSLKDVYTADVFNVPYKRKGRTYVQVGEGTTFEHNDIAAKGFGDYIKVDKEIDKLVQEIDMYLTRFAPDFLYMGLGESFRSKLATLDNQVITTGGNFVYIVGSKVYFASEMLEKLQRQLEALKKVKNAEQQMSFKLEAYFGKLQGETESFTIVSAKNKEGTLESHTIKMRSSYGF